MIRRSGSWSSNFRILRRAFTQVKNGRPGPVLIEFPSDLLREEISGPIDYQKTPVCLMDEEDRRWLHDELVKAKLRGK